jgi:predicted metal-dependent hydrolase
VKREVELVVAGESVVAEVRESRRARRLRIVVRPGKPVAVTVPLRTPKRAVLRFLDDNADWLAQTLAAARAEAARRHILGLEQPGTVWIDGERLAIVLVGGERPSAVRQGARLYVSGDPAIAIDRWYRREARAVLGEAVERNGRRLGVRHERLAVRDQRSRWGSCSTRGTLSLNWRLMLTPPDVLEYVVVHELLHLIEPNHSRAFWRLLDIHRPSWRDQEGWLREHGDEVLEYDVAALC